MFAKRNNKKINAILLSSLFPFVFNGLIIFGIIMINKVVNGYSIGQNSLDIAYGPINIFTFIGAIFLGNVIYQWSIFKSSKKAVKEK